MGRDVETRTHPLSQLCEVAQLGDEAKGLLRDGLGPREYLAVLEAEGLFPDAIRLLSFSLPKREAIWWAWSCARRSLGPEPDPLASAALAATERWIVEPTDEHRRAAFAAGEGADLGTPAGCAALAVFLSGGSLAPPELPPVDPPIDGAARAIAGTVLMAAVVTEPEKAMEKYADYLAFGLDVARRVNLWP